MIQHYFIEIASDRVQDALDDEPDNIDLSMQNSDFCDEWQIIASDITRKFAGKKIKITVQLIKK